LDNNCCVCGETLDPANTSRCRVCGGYFHMAWSIQADVQNCGTYYLNDVSCGLSFVCSNCQQGLQADPDQSANHSATW